MTRWASIVVARKWWVLAVVLIAAVVAGIWGTGVFSKLSQGGYTDPGSESAQVSKIVDDNFGRQDPDIVAIYTSLRGRPSPSWSRSSPRPSTGSRPTCRPSR